MTWQRSRPTHRQRAEVEDRVKTLKATGASQLPFHIFADNAGWLELTLGAKSLVLVRHAEEPPRFLSFGA